MAVSPQFVNPHGQGAKTVWPLTVIGSGDQSATGAAGGATAITVTGQTGRNVVVRQIAWSYSADPAAGTTISIADSAGSPVTYFSLHVTANGPDGWIFSPPLAMPKGLNAVVTLSAPGGAVEGKLFVNAYVQQ